MLRHGYVCVLIFLLIFSPSVFSFQLGNKIETIVIMRHGEKPALGLGQLNCQGLNRALFLPRVLYKKFGKPDFIFAPDPKHKVFDWLNFYNYVRPLTTIEPTAIQFNMPVQTMFSYADVQGTANELIAEKYHHSTLFVAWEHFKAYEIAKEIVKLAGGNANMIPFWVMTDFDSLYVIKIDWSATPAHVSFFHDYQKLNDHSSICPAMMPNQSPLASTESLVKTEKFILIPEAEMSTDENGQLSCQGLNRSLRLTVKLKDLIGEVDEFVAAGPSDQVYDGAGKSHYYQRAVMTIEPATIYAGKPINTPAGYKDVQSALTFLNKDKFYNKTLAIAWKREELVLLAKALHQLNGGNIADIPDVIPDHDAMYLITVTRSGNTIRSHFKTFHQNLNNQSKICPLAIEPIHYSMIRFIKRLFSNTNYFDYGKFIDRLKTHAVFTKSKEE